MHVQFGSTASLKKVLLMNTRVIEGSKLVGTTLRPQPKPLVATPLILPISANKARFRAFADGASLRDRQKLQKSDHSRDTR